MSETEITRNFAGEDRCFDLHGAHLLAAEAEAGASIMEIVNGLREAVLAMAGGLGHPTYRTGFVRAVLKHGLAGGMGEPMTQVDRLIAQISAEHWQRQAAKAAEEIVAEHFDGDIASRHILLAAEVAAAAFYGAAALPKAS